MAGIHDVQQIQRAAIVLQPEDDWLFSVNLYIITYNYDPYTVGDDFGRYLPCDYKLLHEVALNSYNNGYEQFGRALQDLIFLCGDNMERLSECKYLKQVEVEYTKTLLTEILKD